MEQEFEGQGRDNILFLESNVDAEDVNGVRQAPNTRVRMNRLREAIPSASTLPFIIGQAGRFANAAGAPGGTNETAWRNLFTGWIGEAEQDVHDFVVEAWWKRTGLNKIQLIVDLEYTGSETFDPWENGGSVAFIAYESTKPHKIHLTNLMRVIDWLDFEDVMEPGDKVRLSNEYTAEVPTDFSNLRVVAFVEIDHDESGRDIVGGVHATMGDAPAPSEPEPTVPELTCSILPASVSRDVGQSHTVRATVRQQSGAAISGADVTLSVTEGPHTGQAVTFKTDATGEVGLTYTGETVGTDTIIGGGSMEHESGLLEFNCGQASVNWSEASATREPPPLETPVPVDPEGTIYLPIALWNHPLGDS